MSNRLAQAQSLYLRKHAENPIDWRPWGEEALEVARTENKPIFLSIGYSSCHWCTVMEGEAFSDRAIADYLNTNFVPIKVDREERPDLDSIYMQSLQMMIGQGGWPLNVFLSSDDLVPFYGGTYFPVEPRYGRPGFLELLQAIRRFYDGDKEKLQAFKTEILNTLEQSILLPQQSDPLSAELLQGGIETCTRIISQREPNRPSFPMMPYSFLVLQSRRWGEKLPGIHPEKVAVRRGNDLSLGGIYDHVGGGFHRYTVDATWTVPHFEKMLYDNGQILEYLANLWRCGCCEPAYKRAIVGTVAWLQREMTAPEGYFYAAQDADNFAKAEDAEPEEGDFYTWNYRELEQVLTELELQELQSEFDISPEGNFEGKIVLQRQRQGVLSETLEIALCKLFKGRYGEDREAITTFPPARNNQEAKTKDWPGRIPPVTDTKMIAAWNSLTISGLAIAAIALQQPAYLDLAATAARFILEHQWLGDRFHRLNYEGKVAVLAQSEDYALFVKALLDLHQASLALAPDEADGWLAKAIKVQQEFDELFWSDVASGYYNTAEDASADLLVRERSYIDNATPATNGVAIANLSRLFLLTENASHLDRAERGLQAFRSAMEQSPQACPSLFIALDWYRHGTLVRSTRDLLPPLLSQYSPVTAYQAIAELPENTAGLVCQGLSCLEPAQTREQLLEQIEQSQTR